MALESGTYINSLNASNPASTDGLGQADDHLRLIKSTLKATLPNLSGPVTATQAELNALDGYTGTTADLNILSGASAAGVTATELQYLDGVTSGIQSQLDAITGSGTTVNDGTVTIQAGTLLSTGGSFTTNQASASTITLDHSTVSRSNTTTSVSPAAGNTFTAIDQVTSDSYGHITGVRTKTVTMPSSASGGIALTDLSVGTEGTASGNGSLSYNSSTGVFTYSPPTAAGLGALTAHPNISAASSSNNSGNTFIQDITVDSNGHITAIATGTSSATVPTTYGAVGTYVFATADNNGFTQGSTYAGSGLNPTGIHSGDSDPPSQDATITAGVLANSNDTLSGTWRAMGRSNLVSNFARNRATLFVRIS